jgi:hypothetical protein
MAGAGFFGLSDLLSPSGREKTQASKQQRELAAQSADIARQLFEGSAGLRSGGTSQLEAFLGTGTLPAALQQTPLPPLANTYAPARDALEAQYDVARENVLSRTPTRGGQLHDALVDVETRRAQALGGLSADIARQEQARQDQTLLTENALRSGLFEAALRTGYGQGPVALGGLNAAAGQFGSVANRALHEQLKREEAMKEEMEMAGRMVAMGG